MRLGPKACDISQFGTSSKQLGRFVESSLLRDRRLSERERIVLILYYEWEFNLKEIGDVLGVSECRASQLLTKAVRDQKERIQAEESRTQEGERQLRKPSSIPFEIQKRPSMDETPQRNLETICSKAIDRMGEGAVEEIPQALFAAFGVNAF